MKHAIVLFLFLTLSNFVFAKDVAPPSLEDQGSSFINNNGDNSQDLSPDGNAQDVFGAPSDDSSSNDVPPELAEPAPSQPRKQRAAVKPAAVAKKGFCDIRILMKCEGQPIKNRQVALQMDGVSYPKNTSEGGELVQSFSCPQGPKGKKFILKFVEFKTEISMEKVPYSIDIPKRQCL